MTYRQLPPSSFLRECLDLDPETGNLTWKHRPRAHFATLRAWASWNAKAAGSPAFVSHSFGGYNTGFVGGVKYFAHRIVWKLVHGEDPGEIDHINGIRTDNRPANLRVVPRSINCKNCALRSDNTSGHVGVYWDRAKKRWCAEINLNRRVIKLGRFKALEDAIAARTSAQVGLGFTARHGDPA